MIGSSKVFLLNSGVCEASSLCSARLSIAELSVEFFAEHTSATAFPVLSTVGCSILVCSGGYNVIAIGR